MHISCVICQDLIDQSASSDVVVLPCGHLFHSHCLYQWLERSKSCPQCRKPTKEKNVTKVFFTTALNVSKQDDCELLTYKLDSANWELQNKTKEVDIFKEKARKLEESNKGLRAMVTKLEHKYTAKSNIIIALKEQISHMAQDLTSMSQIKMKNEQLTEELDLLENIRKIAEATVSEVNNMIKYDQNPKSLATMVVVLKREMEQQKIKTGKQRSYINKLEQEIKKLESEKTSSENAELKIRELENQLETYKYKNDSLKRKLEETKSPETSEQEEDGVKVRKVYKISKKNSTTSPDEMLLKKNVPTPYLPLKSTSITSQTVFQDRKIKKAEEKFTIFKTPSSSAFVNFRPLPSEAFSGLGGHPTCDFPQPSLYKVSFTKKKSQVKRLVRPNKPNQTLDDFLMSPN